jgi:carboxymethylenebutenolidase
MQTARTMPGATGKVGLMGYCLGGLMTFIVTARKGADASVVYYGGDTDKHLEEAPNIRTPLLVHLGEDDEYIPVDACEAIVRALKSNPAAQVFTYPGLRHAFARHRGAHYDREAASLANSRTAAFFKASVLGASAFEAITAVEGLELGSEARRRLESLLTDESLTPEARRKAVLNVYTRKKLASDLAE